MSADLLLDTQVVVWIGGDDPRLRSMFEVVDDPSYTVHISAVAWFEIAVKNRLGKLDVPIGPLRRRLIEAGFLELAIDGNHAEQLEQLPLHHRDPFDRMLIAQALSEEMTIVTSDAEFQQYEGLRIHRP